ncbi:hypothetical protein L1285_01250 [Pseudoalteromonas sp. DL2-H2.2]|uniref:hypothetical protein n=1 Tax=Pseudoalteromonas sp. DL2-H2.2 TaxID=2908889 RepID=UPI001F31D6F4|nr:hypothetical protein [Pseudoalteromonas sp. DL2-H2.2]MCF2906969.1 hypothetical protein [Pseudoalteromonas sp. DL2-H2.2]
MEFKKTLLALGVLSVLSGCGSDNDDTQTNKDQDLTPDTKVTSSEIKGVAAKGTLINAPVTFFRYENGKPVQLESKTAVVTDEKGLFSATVNNAQGIVKAQISVSQDPQSPTYMICDAPVGCGQNDAGSQIAFGERINLTKADPDLVLSTFVNVNESSNTANITPLTHFAAAIAQQRGDMTAESIATAYSEIADLFGLVGALHQMAPAQIEDRASLVDDNDSDDLRYALINAGIAHALFADLGEQNNALSTRLAEAITDIQATDGAFLSNADHDDDASFEFNLSDILVGAELASQQLISLIKADPALANQLGKLSELEKLSTRLHNEMLSADTQSTDRIKGQAQQQSGDDAVAKAAAMVQDIRVFANLFDVADTHGKEVRTQGDEFVALIDDATEMVRSQANSYKLLADVSEALALIDSARRAGQLPNNNQPIKLDDYLELAGATGVAVIDETGLVFSVTASAGEEQLEATAKLTVAEDNQTYTLSVSGKVENTAAALTLHPNSQVQVVLNQPVTTEQLKEGTAPAFDGRQGSLTLDVTIAQKATDTVKNPVSFKGMLSAELTAKHIEKLEHVSRFEGSASWHEYSIRPDTIFVPGMLSLSGAFSAAQGSQFGASLTVKLDNLSEFNPAGFEHFGRLIPDAGTLTIESDSKAKITSKNGESLLIEFQPINQQGIATVITQYIDDENTTPIHTRKISTYQGVDYVEVTSDYGDNFVTKRLERIVPEGTDEFKLQYFRYPQDSNTHYANGLVTFESGEQVPVEQLDWKAWLYAEDKVDLQKLRRFPVDYASIKDVQTLLTPAHSGTFYVAAVDGIYVNFQFLEQDYQVGQSYALPARYIRPYVDHTPEIKVSADGNTIVSTIGELQQSWSSAGDDSTTASYQYVASNNDGVALEYSSVFINAMTQQDSQNALMISTRSFDQFHKLDNSLAAYLQPDTSKEGYTAYFIQPHSLDEKGMPMDESGNYLDPVKHAERTMDYDSYLSAVRDISGTELMIGSQGYAQQAFEEKLYQGYTLNYPGYGQVEVVYYELYNERGYRGTIHFGKPNDTYQIETETNYLDISAAMNVNVKLGEYHVDLSLVGQRTDFKAGELELDVNYQVPGSELKRSFTVFYNTQTEQLSANNAEGVTLVMAETNSDDDSEGEQTLGTIMVGDEQAARIVKRDAGVFIIYANEQIETL